MLEQTLLFVVIEMRLPEHTDSTDTIRGDVNRNNLLAILSLMRESGDKDVDIFINHKSAYTSHQIQDELLKRVASNITSMVIDDVKKSKYYSIIANETRDNSNTELLCVVVRYFNTVTSHEMRSLFTFCL